MKILRKYNHLISLLLALVSLYGLYMVLGPGSHPIVGWLSFFLYIGVVGYWWQWIFHRIFGIHRGSLIGRAYSYISAILLLGFVTSIWVVWYRITPEILWWNYTAVGFLSYGLTYVSRSLKSKKIKIKNTRPYFTANNGLILLYVVSWIIGMYLLFSSKSGEILFSPWQTISSWFFLIYFFAFFLLGIIICSRHKKIVILGLLIFHSFLIHAYLPLSHTQPWGGDVWRIIAAEEQLSNGEAILPVIAGPEMKTRPLFGMDVPEALLIPHKYTYGHLWGTSILFEKTLQVDLKTINIWLVPLLWTLAIPIIFYRIGILLFHSERRALTLVWLSSIPFSLQALGALTLPVSLGYIVFFFVLSLLIQYIQEEKPWQRNVVLLFSFLMFFGYALHAILIWVSMLCSFLFIFLAKQSFIMKLSRKVSWKRIVRGIFTILAIGIIPVIEYVSIGKAYLSSDIIARIKQMIGQLSGWFYASMIRPHDIVSGNIIFNHTPDYAFVGNIFSTIRFHVPFFMVLIWILFMCAWVYWFAHTEKKQWHVFACLSSTVVGGYIIGWFVLEGDRLFTRRLDTMISFLLIIAAIYTAKKYRGHLKKYFSPLTVLISIFLLSWFGTTTFASGPDLRVISNDEYHMASFVSSQIDQHASHHCILADSWLLLSVEALTHGRIVGGGFPIDYQFGQPELTKLYSSFPDNPEQTVQDMALVTQSDSCIVVLAGLSPEKKEKISDFVGESIGSFGETIAWNMDLKKPSE